MQTSICIFTDFDGTITQLDTQEYLLNKYAAPEWREIEEAVGRGEVSDLEALRKEMEMLSVPLAIPEEEIAGIPIDPSFPEFCRFCKEHGLPLTILSGGIDRFIKTILGKYRLATIPFHANSVEIANNQWRIVPNPGPKIRRLCNHCKTYHLLRARSHFKYIVYIGDGNTDRCPATEADIRFARGNLAKFLDEEKIAYFPFESFEDVLRVLSDIIEKLNYPRRAHLVKTFHHTAN